MEPPFLLATGFDTCGNLADAFGGSAAVLLSKAEHLGSFLQAATMRLAVEEMLPTAAPARLFVVHLAVATSGRLGFVDVALTTGVSPRVEHLPVAAAHHCGIVERVAAALTMAGLAIEVKDVAGLLLVLVRSRLALRLALHFRIFLRPLDDGEPAHLAGAGHCPRHVISSPLRSTVTAPGLSIALGGPLIGAVELRVPWGLRRGNALEPEGEVLFAEIEDMLVIAAALLGGVVDCGLIAAILIFDVKDVTATAALRRQVVQLTPAASFL